MFYTYIIKSCKTNRYYVGYSEDVIKRLNQHNAGQNMSIKCGVPWNLVYTECFSNKTDAWKRERQIKKYKGGKAFKMLIGEVA